MELIFIIALGALGLFLFGVRRTKKLNNDPGQQQLVELLIAAGRGETAPVTNFVIKQDWSPRETRKRLLHAMTLVKFKTNPIVYEQAKSYAKMLHDASYKLG